MALYEHDAVLALATGEVARGTEKIRAAYTQLLATNPTFAPGKQSPALVNDDLALTSTRIPTGATVEVAGRQHDGSWLWLIDQPSVTS